LHFYPAAVDAYAQSTSTNVYGNVSDGNIVIGKSACRRGISQEQQQQQEQPAAG
jgi:hypothetical protein